jgi:hypothetical protein
VKDSKTLNKINRIEEGAMIFFFGTIFSTFLNCSIHAASFGIL